MLALSDKELPIFQSSETDLGNYYTYVYTIPKGEYFHTFCGLVEHKEYINILNNEQK